MARGRRAARAAANVQNVQNSLGAKRQPKKASPTTPGGDGDDGAGNNREYIQLHDVEDKGGMIDAVERDISHREFEGPLTLEKDSVYGAIIALPQLARCMDWNPTMVLLCFRACIMLALNYFLQTFGIILVGEASEVMDVLAGKMHLCDFGAPLDDCPDGPGCLGPAGTRMTGPRLYSFDIWSVRTYVRDAMIATWPEEKEKIMANVDPGEYGMENYWGRIMACFLFILLEVRDLLRILSLCELLWFMPTDAGEWVTVDRPEGDDEEPGEGMGLQSEEQEPPPETGVEDDEGGQVHFRVSGMPLFWKIFTIIAVVVPKLFLWQAVAWIGIRWLMETASILNGILGAVTMDFILEFDELIYDSLSGGATRFVMTNIEDFSFERSGGSPTLRHLMMGIPKRLLLTVGVLSFYVWMYYWRFCQRGADGAWVSTPMELPKSCTYHFWEFLTSHVPTESTPFWTMPTETKA